MARVPLKRTMSEEVALTHMQDKLKSTTYFCTNICRGIKKEKDTYHNRMWVGRKQWNCNEMMPGHVLACCSYAQLLQCSLSLGVYANYDGILNRYTKFRHLVTNNKHMQANIIRKKRNGTNNWWRLLVNTAACLWRGNRKTSLKNTKFRYACGQISDRKKESSLA